MPAAFQSLSQKKDLLPYSGTEMALSKSAGFKAQNQVWNVPGSSLKLQLIKTWGVLHIWAFVDLSLELELKAALFFPLR